MSGSNILMVFTLGKKNNYKLPRELTDILIGDSKTVELEETEFIDLYARINSGLAGLEKLRDTMKIIEEFKSYGFRAKYYANLEKGEISYKMQPKNHIGYLG